MAWQHGAAVFPLDEHSIRPLVQDADPALFEIIAFLSAMLEQNLGARLKAQGIREGLNFPRVVARAIHVPLTPALFAESFKFPLFAVYRKTETYEEHTLAAARTTAQWEAVYCLPALSPRQTLELEPILQAVKSVVAFALYKGYDPSGTYADGESIYTRANIRHARLVSAEYVNPETEAPNGVYSAIRMTLEVSERDMPNTDDAQSFLGADLRLHVVGQDGTVMQDVVDASTQLPPSLTSVSPTSGPAAGGTLITLMGSNFVVNTMPTVRLGVADCTSVVVLSDTQVQAVTPPNAAGLSADLTIVNLDDQSATLPAVFTYV